MMKQRMLKKLPLPVLLLLLLLRLRQQQLPPTAVASVAKASSAAAPVPMLVTPRARQAPISRNDVYEKFEAMIDMALTLHLERRPRLDRPGKVEIRIHEQKQADDEARKTQS